MRVITERLEEMPALIDRLYKRLGEGRYGPLVLDGVFGLLGELDDVAFLEEDLLERDVPLLLAAGEEREVHREVQELLPLRVLHDPAGLLVVSTRHALLVPADRLGFLLKRGDDAGKRARLVAELVGRLVVLVGAACRPC